MIYDEWLPHYLSIGVGKDEFFHSTPRILYAYDEAFERQEQREDYKLWRQGAYNYHAFATVLHNAFKPKNAPAEEYLEAPFSEMKRMNDINAGLIEMSEEEKIYWQDRLFSNLNDMQKSYEATHKQ